jgi:non-heme chloroperoxidase
MPRLTVGSERGVPIQLHYNDHGSGRPVVLVHGWPLSGRMWEREVLVLAEAGYRVVTYDRRGFGGSSHPWEGYDYDTLASDLDGLISGLDLDDATLVGFSMGGGEVARYLGTFGKRRVRQAVLLAAATPFLLHTDDNPQGGMTAAMIADREADLRSDRIAFLDGLTTMFFSTPDQGLLVSEAARLYYRDIAAFASPRATVQCLHAFATTDFRGDLAKFNLPTLVVHGDSDRNVPFDVTSKRTHEMVEGSELAVILGAPHGLAVTHGNEVNEILLGFLAR